MNATQRARDMRRRATPAEQLLWSLLRGKKFRGVKFRRQAWVGRHLVDMLSFHPRIAVEVDGASHHPTNRPDAEKDAAMRLQGFAVFRVPNAEIMDNPSRVLDSLGALIDSLQPHSEATSGPSSKEEGSGESPALPTGPTGAAIEER